MLMWHVLIFVALFPPLSALIWMMWGSVMFTGRLTTLFDGPDFFPVLGLSYLVLVGPTLALAVVEFLTRRWRPGLAFSAVAAFVLVPSMMFIAFPQQRFQLTTFVIVGMMGAASAFVSGVAARLLEAVIRQTTATPAEGRRT
jgi:hypothetical protein